MSEGQHTRRPDVVLFLNGLPVAVVELKNPADENATIWQRSTNSRPTRHRYPAFRYNIALIVSDGVQARSERSVRARNGSSPGARLPARRTRRPRMAELQVVLEGVFEKRRFLDLCATSSCSSDPGGGEWSRRWRLPPVPRCQRGGGGNPACAGPGTCGGTLETSGAKAAVIRATAASASSGTLRDPARA